MHFTSKLVAVDMLISYKIVIQRERERERIKYEPIIRNLILCFVSLLVLTLPLVSTIISDKPSIKFIIVVYIKALPTFTSLVLHSFPHYLCTLTGMIGPFLMIMIVVTKAVTKSVFETLIVFLCFSFYFVWNQPPFGPRFICICPN
jgi:hypothetical protein